MPPSADGAPHGLGRSFVISRRLTMSRDDQDPSGKGNDSSSSSDIALIHGVTPDGDLKILRKRNDRIELGGVRPLREGVPITGEVVRLTPRKEFPLLCDVSTELPAPAALSDVAESGSGARKGPAQVATDSYRDNWERIFAPSGARNLPN
jgi:hypothetical protein